MQIYALSCKPGLNIPQNPKSEAQKHFARGGALALNSKAVFFGACRPYYEADEPEYFKIGNELNKIYNLPSMYSGKPVLNYSYSMYLLDILSVAKGNDLVSVLKNKEKYMTDAKKKAAALIMEQAAIDKHINILQIVEKIAPRSLIRLQTKQQKILDGINKTYSKKVCSSFKDAKLFNNIITAGSKFIIQSSPNDKFKRKDFLKFCEEKLAQMNNKNIANAIYEDLQKLPTSENDEDAFIVKYAAYDVDFARSKNKKSVRGKKDDATLEELRTSILIDALFIDSWAEFEHIRSKSDYDFEQKCWKDGKIPWHGKSADAIENIGIVRRSENREKGSMPLDEYVKIHPEVNNYANEYLGTILRETNNRQAEYVQNLAKTLEEEGRGMLRIEPRFLNANKKKTTINIKGK